MLILYSSDGRVDLKAPIFVTGEQREIIVSYFKKNFPEIEVEDIVELHKSTSRPPGNKVNNWKFGEYVDLLRFSDLNKFVGKTGHSEFAVKIKLGDILPDFLKWIKAKGYENKVNDELIYEFLRLRDKK